MTLLSSVGWVACTCAMHEVPIWFCRQREGCTRREISCVCLYGNISTRSLSKSIHHSSCCECHPLGLEKKQLEISSQRVCAILFSVSTVWYSPSITVRISSESCERTQQPSSPRACPRRNVCKTLKQAVESPKSQRSGVFLISIFIPFLIALFAPAPSMVVTQTRGHQIGASPPSPHCGACLALLSPEELNTFFPRRPLASNCDHMPTLYMGALTVGESLMNCFELYP